MKILAFEHELPGATPDAFQVHAKAEATRVWELYQAGVVREAFFRAERPEAVLVLECADVDEARRVLDSLPLVREGLIEFDLISLRPYPGFARLFAREDDQ